MKRTFIGAVLGALAMFLLDPDVGARRRGDLARVVDEGRAGLQETGRRSRRAARKASRRAARSMSGLGGNLGGGSSGPSGGRWVLLLGGVGAAAALGAVLVYALDPNRGAERRARARAALEGAQEKVRQQGSEAVDAAKERLDDVRTQASESVREATGRR